MKTEEVNINISINKNENKVIVTTSNREGDVFLKKEINLQNENNFPIGIGATGVYVRNIQNFIAQLNPKLLDEYGVDGIFGLETERACNRIFNSREISVKQYTMIENFLVSINKFHKS